MTYTLEDYAKLSIRHSLTEDALKYAIDRIWEGTQAGAVLDSLEALYGLTDKEAHNVYRTANYLARRS